MKLNYTYKDITLKEFLSKSSNDVVVNGFGTMSIIEDERLYKVFYVEILGSDCRFIVKSLDDSDTDKDKKIENLQSIIAKNYKKIENQAKEITLLIEQKKELKTEYDDLLSIFDYKKKQLASSYDGREKLYEEIERQKVIIEYLEGKINE